MFQRLIYIAAAANVGNSLEGIKFDVLDSTGRIIPEVTADRDRYLQFWQGALECWGSNEV